MMALIPFGRHAVENLGFVLAGYFESSGKVVVLWILYSIAIEAYLFISSQRTHIDVQGSFPVRPIDARPGEILHRFGTEVVVVTGDDIVSKSTLIMIITELVRYALLYESINTRDSWLAMGIAQGGFIASLCLWREVAANFPVVQQVNARFGLINRQNTYAKRTDRLYPSLKDLIRYQRSLLTGSDSHQMEK